MGGLNVFRYRQAGKGYDGIHVGLRFMWHGKVLDDTFGLEAMSFKQFPWDTLTSFHLDSKARMATSPLSRQQAGD